MLDNRHSKLVALFGLLLVIAGCGSSEVSSDVALKASNDFEQAKAFASNGDFGAAIPLLNSCVESGALQAQLLADVLALRAKAFIQTGQLENALADIEGLETVEGDMSIVHGLKYLYWQKSGNPSNAQAELQLAQRINPSFRAP